MKINEPRINPDNMSRQYGLQYETFCRKNHDYGNSFEKSLDTFGLTAGIVRISDKFERLVSLNDPSKNAQIASESLVDTLEDLSNYAAMAACWIKAKNGKIRSEKEMIGFSRFKDLKWDHSNSQILGKVESYDPETSTVVYKPKSEEVVGKDKLKIDNNAKQFIINTIKEITDTVLRKIQNNDFLTYMDISDGAGRIAKCIVDKKMVVDLAMVIINDYWFDNHIDIPFELRRFIHGTILRHFYYINKIV